MCLRIWFLDQGFTHALSHNQDLVLAWSTQSHAKKLRRGDHIVSWLGTISQLIFIYPGFFALPSAQPVETTLSTPIDSWQPSWP